MTWYLRVLFDRVSTMAGAFTRLTNVCTTDNGKRGKNTEEHARAIKGVRASWAPDDGAKTSAHEAAGSCIKSVQPTVRAANHNDKADQE